MFPLCQRTPRNIQRLPKVPPNLASLIDLVEFPLLTLDNEILPEGAETTVDIPLDKVEHFKIAYDLLQIPFKKFIGDQLPDWIIVDFCAHWAVDIAQEYNVKLVLFTVMSAATTVFLGSQGSEIGHGGRGKKDIQSSCKEGRCYIWR